MHKHEFPFCIGVCKVVFEPCELVFFETVFIGIVGVEHHKVRVCVVERVVFAADWLRRSVLHLCVVEVSAHCAGVVLVVARGEEHGRVERQVLVGVKSHAPLTEVLAVVAHIAGVENEVVAVDALVFEKSGDCLVAFVVHALDHTLDVSDCKEFKLVRILAFCCGEGESLFLVSVELDKIEQREGVDFVFILKVAGNVIVVGFACFESRDGDGGAIVVDHAVCDSLIAIAVNVGVFCCLVFDLTVRNAKESEVDERDVLRLGLGEHAHVYAVYGCVCFGVEIVGLVCLIV